MAEPAELPRPLVRRLVLVAGLALYVAGTIGSNIAPAVIDDHPLTILVLSSRNRNLFASVPFIDPLPYAVVGFLRVLAAGVVLYLIGRWYGAKGIGWVEGQVGELPAIIRWIQRGVDRAGWLLVLLMPGSNIVCLMVGHRRMPPRTFLPLLMTGIVLKLGVLWAGGKLFEDQIRTFLDFIERYQWWIVIALFAVTFIQSAGRVRKSVPEVIEEIERPVAPPDPGALRCRDGRGPRHQVSRVAVVTGASSGIGAATARRLVKEGFEVVVGARRADRLQEVADEIGAVAFPLDVTAPASVEAFCGHIESCDLLVNNAGGALGLDPVERADVADWAAMYDANVLGTLRMTQALLPLLEAGGQGHIVMMGSWAAHEWYVGGAGYNAAKTALRAVTQVLRMELVGRPIRITEIDPGLVETDFSVVRFRGDEARAAQVYEGITPLSADDIADCVAWAVTRPSHVDIDEIVVKPVQQATTRYVHRRPSPTQQEVP